MDDPRSTGDRSKRSTFFPSLLSGHCPLTIPQVTYRLLRIYVCTRPSKYAQHLVYDLFRNDSDQNFTFPLLYALRFIYSSPNTEKLFSFNLPSKRVLSGEMI